jgi:D-aminopeptidase
VRVYIICDMEGTSGVTDWKQVTFSDPSSAQGRRLATLDLIAGGAQEEPVGLSADFDNVLMCGLHAMAGAKGGVLAHSFTQAIAGFWVNGIEMGEIGMNLLTAGELGLPNVFLRGDLAAVREVRVLVPEVECVAVKQGLEP